MDLPPEEGRERTLFLGNINDTKTVLAIFYNFRNNKRTPFNLPSEKSILLQLAENFSLAPLDAGR